MTLPYLPGWWDQTGPALTKLVEGIGKAVAPNWEREQKMRDAIATNPALAQQFIDFNAQNPGALDAMGFGKVAAQFATGRPSFQQQVSTAAQQRLQQNPLGMQQAVSKATGIQTDVENVEDEQKRRMNELDEVIKRATAGVAGVVSKAQGANAEETLRRTQGIINGVSAARPFFESIGGIGNFYKAATGQIPGVDLSALADIRAVPEFDTIYKDQERAAEAEQNEAYRKAMLNAQRSNNRMGVDELLMRSSLEQASKIASNVGFRDVPSLYSIIADPAKMNQALNGQTFGNPQLDAAAEAIRQDASQVGQDAIESAINKFRQNAGTLLNDMRNPEKLKTMSPETYNANIANLNAWSQMAFTNSRLAPPVFNPVTKENWFGKEKPVGFEITGGDPRIRQFGGADIMPAPKAPIDEARDILNTVIGTMPESELIMQIQSAPGLSAADKEKLIAEVRSKTSRGTNRK